MYLWRNSIILALPLRGLALMNSIQRMTPHTYIFLISPSSNEFHQERQEQSLLNWLPKSSGSPLQDLSGSFASKNNSKSQSKSHQAYAKGKDKQFHFVWYNDQIMTRIPVTKLDQNINHMKSSPINQQCSQTASSVGNETDGNQTSDNADYSNILETYFPFLETTTSPNKPLYFLPSGESVRGQMEGNLVFIDALTILKDKNPNDTVTIEDLRIVLEYAESINSKSQDVPTKHSPDSGVKAVPTGIVQPMRSHSGKKVSSTQVAFPQPSILSYVDVQRGTIFAGGLMGMILGMTILPNLWLAGLLIGSLYGLEITMQSHESQRNDSKPKLVGKYLITIGRMTAVKMLQFCDYWKTLWFLYKTGQLSYEYYKRYEVLDRKFEIQNKLDAWNRLFSEGKKKFDTWEQENEIGRTILAGLRTVWLIDEQSRRRTREKSKYRVVQFILDAKVFVNRWLTNTRVWAKSLFQKGGMTKFIVELRSYLATGESLNARFTALLVTVATVNIGGLLFSISPGLSNFFAVLLALTKPSESLHVFLWQRDQGAEINAKDDRGVHPTTSQLLRTFNAPDFMRRYDRRLFHYYTRLDGTKKYYRTGQSFSANRHNPTRPRFFLGQVSRRTKWKAKPGDAWLGFPPSASR
jgi:hypothetical protein